ncbi:MAG: ABC transporter ATP-binding protein [bacterium]|nr:ABC transporter ATP-binding protein [bacterium]
MRDVVQPQQAVTDLSSDNDMLPKIAVDRVGKRFAAAQHDAWALQNVTFSVCHGQFIALVGESGCGKTTLLRLIAGLETSTSGSLHLNGQEVRGPSQEVGFVFQHPVLLPWRTVLDNVLLPVELARQSRRVARQQALDLLRLFDLQAFAGHRPQHLSGGMQQRVALARTLMLQPSVLLMDEPFGALDAITREQLNLELLRMWRHGQQTVLFITHDIAEAVFLADRVLVMSRRPGTIAAAFTVPLARPRDLDMRFEAPFAALCRDIHHAMGLMRHDSQE